MVTQLFIFLVLMNGTFLAKGGKFIDIEKLYNDKLSGYNKHLRPIVDTFKPITIYCTFQLVAIKELDEVNGKLSVVGFFEVMWNDHRITWNPVAYNHTYMLDVPENEIWTPEITLANPYDQLNSLGKGFMSVMYFSDGTALWFPGDVLSISCPLDVTYYPFDTQTCTLQMVCWGTSVSQISLLTPTDKVKQDFYIEHGTWELLDTVSTNVTMDIPVIHLTLTIRRRSQFYTVNVILPVMFMVVLNILVFVLPVESGERISYSITVLLALAVFLTLVGENLPKTSKPMSILSYFLLADLILSAVICFGTIYGLNVYFRDDNENPVPLWLQRLVNSCRCRRKKSSVYNKASKAKKCKVDLIEKSTTKISDIAWVLEEPTKVTWKMVARWLDSGMMVTSVIVLVVLKTVFFAITMSS
ncbi:hypothetical protein FSP39_003207 [Pinctada imbricata]|uniref:Uncharacterized protein n=1 Tax=Pinctada imbricata TaxID=66713 RepID=A0AA88YAT2_PINIB|nr:hypothetical protein FSP39_003207 [Pinctada imbricata]